MKRIFNGFAYTDEPRKNCWWDQTSDIVDRLALNGDVSCDVAVVGGGFTGLSAALRLAEAGYSVATVAFVVSVGGGLMMWRSTSLRGGKIG
jgi:ribulose 1,5-bisphosphate synthetase/thiazole synthase